MPFYVLANLLNQKFLQKKFFKKQLFTKLKGGFLWFEVEI